MNIPSLKDLKLQNDDSGSRKTRKSALQNSVDKRKKPSKEKIANKPHAPWRPLAEFNRLIEKGVCVRCGEGGHVGTRCPTYQKALRPKSDLSQLDENSTDDESDSNSGNEDP